MPNIAESGQIDLITIEGRFPGLNDYINAERTNRMKAAGMKKKAQRAMRPFILNAIQRGTLHRHVGKCEIWITWVEPNKRRDIDNVSFAVKFLLDELVNDGIFPDDDQNYIRLIHHTIATDQLHPRVFVTIREAGRHDQQSSINRPVDEGR